MTLIRKLRSSSQPILLIGASGMLGHAWKRLLTANDILFEAPARTKLNLVDDDSIRNAITPYYRLVVNCAGYTDVDRAEGNREMAYRVNARAIRLLAERCSQFDIPFIHYSTDYVFDGSFSRPYPIAYPTRPVNVYGRTKLQGERFVRASGCRHLVIRTSWLYAPWGKNFVTTMVDLMKNRDVVQVVHDQCGRPTSAEELALFSWQLAIRQLWGTWHVTDAGQCTWFELASKIRDLTSDCRIEPCDTRAFERSAKRPVYSVLDVSETDRVLGSPRPWQSNVAQVLEKIKEAQTPRSTKLAIDLPS